MSETQLATVERPSHGLARATEALPALVFTPQDLAVINDTIAKGLTDGERQFFIQACQSTGLNPLLKEIYVWKDGGKLILHTGIDGLCKIAADHHPDYCGLEGPYWCGGDGQWRDFWPKTFGNPVAAKVRVVLRGARTGFFTVMWDNFAKPGSPTWKAMPAHMLGVAATRHALRRTCPRAQKQIDMLALSDELDTSAANGLEPRITEDPAPALNPGPVNQPTPEPRSQPAPSAAQPSSRISTAPQKRSATAGLTGPWNARAAAKFYALGGPKGTALWHFQQIIPELQFINQATDEQWQQICSAFDAHECLPGEPGWPLEADVQDETPTAPVVDDPFAEE